MVLRIFCQHARLSSGFVLATGSEIILGTPLLINRTNIDALGF